MLSCGSWVKDMLDWNMLCKKVVIVGASDKLIRTVPEEYGQRVSFYSEATLAHEKAGTISPLRILKDRFTCP